MRLASHEAIVACPRVMRPGLEDVTCEADMLVAVRGVRQAGQWLDVLSAQCQHTLTDEEEGAVLDQACDHLTTRYAERDR